MLGARGCGPLHNPESALRRGRFGLGSKTRNELRGAVNILATIATRAAAEGLSFLVIGGNAVIAYGYARMTRDIDLLVSDADRRAWDALITSLGYMPHQVARAFHMYNPLSPGLPPVDLMLVESGTFAKLTAAPNHCSLDEVPVSIPALPHLIALKLHALRHGEHYRHTRDFGDVVELIQINNVNLATPEYQEILERYADEDTRRKLAESLPGSFGPKSPGV